jgi:hypothetical protein
VCVCVCVCVCVWKMHFCVRLYMCVKRVCMWERENLSICIKIKLEYVKRTSASVCKKCHTQGCTCFIQVLGEAQTLGFQWCHPSIFMRIAKPALLWPIYEKPQTYTWQVFFRGEKHEKYTSVSAMDILPRNVYKHCYWPTYFLIFPVMTCCKILRQPIQNSWWKLARSSFSYELYFAQLTSWQK